MKDLIVMIPTYNAEKYIATSINSIKNQNENINILVVDNQSTDSTVEILKNEGIDFVVNDKNLGRIGNWNKCLDIFEDSEFKWLQFCFMGDELSENYSQEISHVIENLENSVTTISWPYRFNDNKNKISKSPSKFNSDCIKSYEEVIIEIGAGNYLGAIISVLLSKESIKNNRFDEEFIGISLFYDRALTTGNTYYLNKPITQFNQNSHKTFALSLSEHGIFEKVYLRSYLNEKYKNLLGEKNYEEMKKNIFADFIQDLMYVELFKLSLIAKKYIKKVVNKIKQLIKS